MSLTIRRLQYASAFLNVSKESEDNQSVILLHPRSKIDNSKSFIYYGSTLFDCGKKIFRAHYWINTAGEKSLELYEYSEPHHTTKIDYIARNNLPLFYERLAKEYPEVYEYFLFNPDKLFGDLL